MERVAAALSGLGLRPGARLLLAMDNRTEFVEAFFGAMRAGVVPIPLNVKLSADTIRFIVALPRSSDLPRDRPVAPRRRVRGVGLGA